MEYDHITKWSLLEPSIIAADRAYHFFLNKSYQKRHEVDLESLPFCGEFTNLFSTFARFIYLFWK